MGTSPLSREDGSSSFRVDIAVLSTTATGWQSVLGTQVEQVGTAAP